MDDQEVVKRLHTDHVIDLSHEWVEEVASAFGDEETSDAILIIEGHRLPVHRILLSIQSNYFKTLFSKRFEGHEKQEFDLKDVDVTGFELLLQYIYKKRVNLKELNHYQVMALFSTSKQFLFLTLSKKMINFMATTTSSGSNAGPDAEIPLEVALGWFSLALKYEETELLEKLKPFLELKAEMLLKEPSFSTSSFDVIRELLSSDAFYTKEVDIFQFLTDWIKVQAKEGNEVDAKDVYSLVRFPLISGKSLINKVLPAVKGLDLDFKQHEGRYRGLFSYEQTLKLRTPDDTFSYLGPGLLSSGYSFDNDWKRRSFSVEFEKPHAIYHLVMKTESHHMNRQEWRLFFKVNDGEDGDQVTGEVRCRSIPCNGYYVYIVLTPFIMASKITVQDLSPEMNLLNSMTIMSGQHDSIALKTEISLRVMAIDEAKKHYLVGASLGSRDTAQAFMGNDQVFSHPIGSSEGITFFFVTNYLSKHFVIYLPEEAKYDFDVLLSSDGDLFERQESFTRASGNVEMVFNEKVVSAIRLIGRKSHVSGQNTFVVNNLLFKITGNEKK